MSEHSDRFIGRRMGRYVLQERLGGGGSGAVYTAWDEVLERQVALKLFVPIPGAPAETLERFRQEAVLTARLNHPNIVPIYDVGDDDGYFYIAMRRLPGETLGNRLSQQGRLYQDEAIKIALALSDALAFAHARGIVHRDLKPANVLFDEEGRPLLADFGIAKTIDGSEGLTVTGTTIGTPAYMSPEQAAGNALDHRSDLYSLGVLLFQMVTGRAPFEGNPPSVMRAHLFDPPPAPSSLRPDVDAELEKVILKALAKEPEGRFTGAEAMAGALRAVMRGESTGIHLPAPPPAARPGAADAPTRLLDSTPPPTAVPRPRPGGSGRRGGPPRGTLAPARAAGSGFPIWTLTILVLSLFCTAGAVATGALYSNLIAPLNPVVAEPPTEVVLEEVVLPPTATPSATLPPSPTLSPEPDATETPTPSPTVEPSGTPEPTPTPSQTPRPTASATPPPTATSAPSPTESSLPPTPTGTPSPQPTLVVTPNCSIEPHAAFAGFFDRDIMGCPTTIARSVEGPYQRFQNGFMVNDPVEGLIYVFSGNIWLQFRDLWEPGDPDFSCTEAEDAGGPVGGFGLVWCERPEVRGALGNVAGGEIVNVMIFQPAGEALMINLPARRARLALFSNFSYFEEIR